MSESTEDPFGDSSAVFCNALFSPRSSGNIDEGTLEEIIEVEEETPTTIYEIPTTTEESLSGNHSLGNSFKDSYEDSSSIVSCDDDDDDENDEDEVKDEKEQVDEEIGSAITVFHTRRSSSVSSGIFKWEDLLFCDKAPEEEQFHKIRRVEPSSLSSSYSNSTGADLLSSKVKVGGITDVEVSEEPSKPPVKKLIRIRLPDNSYRTFPVNSTTTLDSIMDKITSKLAIERPEEDYTKNHIFQVDENNETELQAESFVVDILSKADDSSEFIYKKKGEKVIDIKEELKQIEKENQMLEKKKEDIQVALSTWLGDSKPIVQVNHQNQQIDLDNRRIFAPLVCEANPTTSVKGINMFSNLERIATLLEEKISLTHRITQQKKPKNTKNQKMFVEFAAFPAVSQTISVRTLESKLSELAIHSVFVNGWKCYVKEYLCHPNDASSLHKALTEISFLELLPPHPNILRYYYHKQIESNIQLFVESYGQSLKSFIEKWEEPFLPNSLIRSILLSTCNGLKYLHSYNIIHNNLSSEIIYLQYYNGSLIDLIIGSLYCAIQLSHTGTASEGIDYNHSCFSAPEYFAEGSSCRPGLHSDIYSFGMICYFLIQKQEPYSNIERKDLLKVMKIPSTKPKITREDASLEPFIKIYEACTLWDAKKRPNALQLKQMLWALPDN